MRGLCSFKHSQNDRRHSNQDIVSHRSAGVGVLACAEFRMGTDRRRCRESGNCCERCGRGRLGGIAKRGDRVSCERFLRWHVFGQHRDRHQLPCGHAGNIRVFVHGRDALCTCVQIDARKREGYNKGQRRRYVELRVVRFRHTHAENAFRCRHHNGRHELFAYACRRPGGQVHLRQSGGGRRHDDEWRAPCRYPQQEPLRCRSGEETGDGDRP